MNNSVIFLKLSVKKSIFQVSNSAVVKVLNKRTGTFSPTYIVIRAKSELAEYRRDCGGILFIILFVGIADQ
jgi:hypothetical protein